jgi:hypothetical protein
VFGLSSEPGSVLDNDVAFSIETTTEELSDKPDATAAEILRYVLFAVNSPHLMDTQPKLEELLRMGCEFNSWRAKGSLADRIKSL